VKDPSVSHFLDICLLISNIERTLNRNESHTHLP